MAVAQSLFRLMAYKDEYEVARLYTETTFMASLRKQFDGPLKLRFHLAPPLFAQRDPVSGHLRKVRIGPWMQRAFMVLAKGRRLRGTPLDPFGYTAERRMERELITEYERTIEGILSTLTMHNHLSAVKVAEAAQAIRGFGHVKLSSVASFRNRQEAAIQRYQSAPTSKEEATSWVRCCHERRRLGGGRGNSGKPSHLIGPKTNQRTPPDQAARALEVWGRVVKPYPPPKRSPRRLTQRWSTASGRHARPVSRWCDFDATRRQCNSVAAAGGDAVVECAQLIASYDLWTPAEKAALVSESLQPSGHVRRGAPIRRQSRAASDLATDSDAYGRRSVFGLRATPDCRQATPRRRSIQLRTAP